MTNSVETDRFFTWEPKSTDGLKSSRNHAVTSRSSLYTLHVRRLETRGDVPIDVTDIVVILVLAQIGEIQPETAKQGLVIAMQQPVQATNHGPLQATQDVLRAGRGTDLD